MTLLNFDMKPLFVSKYTICTWDENITFNRISTNYIIVEMICQQPSIFKRALRKRVLRILNQKAFRFAGMSKLKEAICIHIYKLDERDLRLMLLTVHAIYKFIRLRFVKKCMTKVIKCSFT
ncbi:hypothetical protein THOM_2704 [Trachipleistophora hominis]|uniref:Uncharacterized protein n=1 Tax=Trachipleistophora hominis TaxID=72359 RepID=L7JUE7_TRAHO|nr:hypothetical protein THOM_2704 [Trachipleistophora hominis]